MKITFTDTQGVPEEYQAQQKTIIHLRTRFFDSYKAQFRSPKEYK